MIKKIIYVFLSAIFYLNVSAQDQQHSEVLAAVDSTNFSINRDENWELYKAAFTPLVNDTVLLEMIVEHDRFLEWENEQLIGKIKEKDYVPYTEQSVDFKLLTDSYNLRIDLDGKCYLRLVEGEIPPSDPVFIPIRLYYLR